jgi:hypothetical protein
LRVAWNRCGNTWFSSASTKKLGPFDSKTAYALPRDSKI